MLYNNKTKTNTLTHCKVFNKKAYVKKHYYDALDMLNKHIVNSVDTTANCNDVANENSNYNNIRLELEYIDNDVIRLLSALNSYTNSVAKNTNEFYSARDMHCKTISKQQIKSILYKFILDSLQHNK